MSKKLFSKLTPRWGALFCILLGLVLLTSPALVLYLGTHLQAYLLLRGTARTLAADRWECAEAGTGATVRAKLAEQTHVDIRLKETKCAADVVALLNQKQADFGLIYSTTTQEAVDLNTVGSWQRRYLHIVTPAGVAITTVHDLAGLRIGIAHTSTDSAALIENVFSFLNLEEPVSLRYEHNLDLAQAFLDDEIDAACLVRPLFDPLMEELLKTGWYDLIPLPEAKAIAQYIPGAYADMLPVGLYGPGRSIPAPNTDAFPVLAVDLLLTARTDLPLAIRAALQKTIPTKELDKQSPTQPSPTAQNALLEKRLAQMALQALGVLLFILGCYNLRNKKRTTLILPPDNAPLRPYLEQLQEIDQWLQDPEDASATNRALNTVYMAIRMAEQGVMHNRLSWEQFHTLSALHLLRLQIAQSRLQSLQQQNAVPQVETASPLYLHHEPTTEAPSFTPPQPTETFSVRDAAPSPVSPSPESYEAPIPASSAVYQETASEEDIYENSSYDNHPDAASNEEDAEVPTTVPFEEGREEEITEERTSSYTKEHPKSFLYGHSQSDELPPTSFQEEEEQNSGFPGAFEAGEEQAGALPNSFQEEEKEEEEEDDLQLQLF